MYETLRLSVANPYMIHADDAVCCNVVHDDGGTKLENGNYCVMPVGHDNIHLLLSVHQLVNFGYRIADVLCLAADLLSNSIL